MDVTDIEVDRDGGTIRFRVLAGSALAGRYRLQTPFLGDPSAALRRQSAAG